MANETDVNAESSPANGEVDERGVPIKNLKAEMDRKFSKLEEKLDTVVTHLEGFTTAPETPPVQNVAQGVQDAYDPRADVSELSADPRRYFGKHIGPLQQKLEAIEKENQDLRERYVRAEWDRASTNIAAMEGKKAWRDLPKEVQDEIVGVVKQYGWNQNPERAMDAYEVVQARKRQKESGEPIRHEMVERSQPEGAGRISGKSPVNSISTALLRDLVKTPPTSPDYKKNMELVGKVQSGLIKLEG